MNKRVLIIDDDKDLVSGLEQALRFNGYEVSAAYSGIAGLAELERFEPHLIILDVMMETDTAGFEVACRIRRNRTSNRYDRFKDVPIIMLTAITQVTNSRFSLNEEQSFLPGVEEFVTKPIDIDDLLEKIRRLT
jgi:CheY-like chemotaxis protein